MTLKVAPSLVKTIEIFCIEMGMSVEAFRDGERLGGSSRVGERDDQTDVGHVRHKQVILPRLERVNDRLLVHLIRDVQDVRREQQVRIGPQLPQVVVGRIVPDGVRVEGETVRQDWEMIALFDDVRLRGGRSFQSVGPRTVARRNAATTPSSRSGGGVLSCASRIILIALPIYLSQRAENEPWARPGHPVTHGRQRPLAELYLQVLR